MPIKKHAGQGDEHHEEKMDVDSNTNALGAADAVRPPHLSPNSDFAIQKTPNDPHPSESTRTEEVSEDECPARSSGVIEWTFKDIKDPRTTELKNDLRLTSDPFTIRCLPWKILAVFSRPEVRSAMGMFLQCNADSPLTTWTCFGRATLELLSQTKSSSKKYTIGHTFTHKENDWGYQTFIPYNDLFNPENGYVVDKTIRARIKIEAEAPHGADWDSKKYTGFVGLKNQGATCYLNSVLQALYCTNALRKAVFQMPTESDDSASSVPLALQRTFFDLQCSEMAVGTEKLTRSFGWNTWDSFMQHDAQELCRVLLDNMESKMKGTDVESVIPRLFCGKMVSYIRCKNVDYESKREENFYDIQLKVKGNQGVHEAFKEYVQVETLDKDNKYDAGKFGLQDAEKGVKFVRFPPVLYLQLMRFQYDFESNTNVKINDRFEFPYELDLSEYLVQQPSVAEDNDGAPHYTKYFLQAVLVHSGYHHGGHYVVHINPRGDNKWYQFDDDVVCSCTPKNAIEQNYGNNDDSDSRAFTNAYMLVYIACDARDDVLCSVTEDMVPLDLSSRFHEEQEVEEQKRREKNCAHEFATVNLLLEEDFIGSEDLELFRADQLPIRSIRVRRQDSSNEKIIEAAANVLRWGPRDFRLWRVTQKPQTVLQTQEQCKSMCQLEFSDRLNIDLSRDNVVTLWAERLSPTANPFAGVAAPASRLFFFKFFDPRICSLCYCGHVAVPLPAPPNVADVLQGLLRKRVGLHDDTQLAFFRQDDTGRPQPVDLNTVSLQTKQGEVLYFRVENGCEEVGQEVAVPDANMEDIGCVGNGAATDDNRHRIVHSQSPDISLNLRKMAINSHKPQSTSFFNQYFKSSSDMVDILLVDKLRKSDPGMLIRVSTELSYRDFAELASSYLSTRPDRFQFFASVASNSTATGGAAASPVLNTSKSAPQPPPTTAQEVATNPSPESIAGNDGNGYSPNNNGFSGASLISEQTKAARASGFAAASPNIIGALATAACQGLSREPPGLPISSKTTGTLRDFLSLPPGPNIITTTTSVSDRQPLCVSRYTATPSITSSPFSTYNLHRAAPRRVYYAHTALPIHELESLRQVQVAYVGPRLSDRLDLALSVPSGGTVSDLLAEVRSHITLTGSKKLRLMEIRYNRIIQIYSDGQPLEKIDGQLVALASDPMDNVKSGLRVEEIPTDEENLQQGDVVINVAHFNKDKNDTFGVPFTVRLRNGELYSDVKKRIREKLDVASEKEFDAWNFVLVTCQRSVSIPNGTNVVVDTSVFHRDSGTTPRPWLGVEHKPPKRPRYAHSEKSIKIHN